MAIFKRGSTYWYQFRFSGVRIRESARTVNKDAARTIEAAHRVRLAKGEAGVSQRGPVPTLAQFAPRFVSAIETACADKPATVSFYNEKLRRLLDDAELSKTPLDAIREEAIAVYIGRRRRAVSRYGKQLAVGSLNRELAALRRLLRLAEEWKIIDRAPRVRLLRGERSREFVLNHKTEAEYLAAAPELLRDVATLALDTGLRVGEAVALEWSDVRLGTAVHARSGFIVVRSGKSRNAKRSLVLTSRAAEMLKRRKAASKSIWVFPGKSDAAHVHGTSLDHDHAKVRARLKLPEDFVIHSFRHTYLTRLGASGTDAFTIMRLAGHASITTSQKYVHPTSEAAALAVERLEAVNVAQTAGVTTKVATVGKIAPRKKLVSGL